jgi:hypothetical protein
MSSSVEKALKAISNANNLSSGLAHSLDSSRTKEMLTFLKKEGEILDAHEIFDWAIQNKWTQEGAKDLKELVDKLNDGKSLIPSQKGMWNEEFLATFKKK